MRSSDWSSDVCSSDLFFVPQSWIDRMQTIETYQGDGSALSRLEVWGFALKLTKDRPIVGGGFRVSYNDAIYLKYVPDARTGRGRNYHSVYFEILGELGYVRSEEHTSELQSLMR